MLILDRQQLQKVRLLRQRGTVMLIQQYDPVGFAAEKQAFEVLPDLPGFLRRGVVAE